MIVSGGHYLFENIIYVDAEIALDECPTSHRGKTTCCGGLR